MSQQPANFRQPITAEEINPYAPTVSAEMVAPELSDAESLRKTHLNHEASVKAIGTLHLLGASLLIFMSLVMIVGALFGGPQDPVGALIAMGAVYLGLD